MAGTGADDPGANPWTSSPPPPSSSPPSPASGWGSPPLPGPDALLPPPPAPSAAQNQSLPPPSDVGAAVQAGPPDYRPGVRPLRQPGVAQYLRIASGLAAVAAASVIVGGLVVQRQVPWVQYLLVLGVPILIVGQLHAIFVALTRQRRREDIEHQEGRGRPWWRRGAQKEDLFGEVSPGAVRLATGLFVLAWLTAMSSFILAGAPTATPGTCETTLTEHGVSRCVDRDERDRYDASFQRFGAAVLLGFFIMHTAVAHGAVREHESRPDPLDP